MSFGSAAIDIAAIQASIAANQLDVIGGTTVGRHTGRNVTVPGISHIGVRTSTKSEDEDHNRFATPEDAVDFVHRAVLAYERLLNCASDEPWDVEERREIARAAVAQTIAARLK